MSRSGFGRRVPGLALAALLTSGVLAFAQEEVYRATFTAARGMGRKTAELTLTIRSRTNEEEAAKLQKVLAEQGSDAAVALIRGWDRGMAHITGGPTSTIRHVRVHPGQNGARVIIVTDEPLYFPEDAPSPGAPRNESSVGVIDLVVDSAGKGTGNMVEAMAVRITEEGVLQVVTPGRVKIDLENVEKLR